jgi:hypothetical protein
MEYYRALGEAAFHQMNDEDYYYTPQEDTNSIAQIIRHMHGNMMSRWTRFLEEDGEKPWRKRDEEFESSDEPVPSLLEKWNEGWNCFLNALRSLGKDDLNRIVHIRQESLTVTDAILRQVAHYSYHVGQIVYIAKLRRGADWKSLSIPLNKKGK